MHRPAAAAHAALLATPPRGNHQVVWPAEWWTDSLETGDNWTYSGTGGDDVHEPAAAACRAGTLGLYLKTRTTGAANGDNIIARQLCTTPTEDYLATTFYCRLPSKTPNYAIVCHLGLRTGGREWIADVVHLTASNKWQYTNSAGASVDIPGGAYTWPANTWVPIIIRLRVSTKKYMILTLGGTDYDLTAQGLYDSGAAGSTDIVVDVRSFANPAAPTTAHFDTFLLTHSPNP